MKRFRVPNLLTNYGLPVTVVIYFAVHVYIVHFGSIPGPQLLALTVVLIGVSLLTQLIFTRVFARSNPVNPKPRASVFTFIVMLLLLFFGVFQDMIAAWQPIAAFGRLIWLMPVSLLLILLCYLAIRRSSSPFLRFRKFLFLLFSIYLVLDFIKLATIAAPADKSQHLHSTAHPSDLVVAPSTAKDSVGNNTELRPSVYLVILDEYLGNEGLLEHFNYSNESFQNFLMQEGFHIVANPHSNHLTTLFSMATTFNMEHLSDMGDLVFTNHYAYKKGFRIIEDNRVCSVFAKLGYTIKNKSFFHVYGRAPGYSTGLMPDKLTLAQHQTMYYRIANALPELLSDQFNLEYFVARKNALAEKNNMRMLEEVLQDAPEAVKKPTFTYLHVLMPHHPVLRDSSGKLLRDPGAPPEVISRERQDTAYLQYLVYTNKVITRFISDLKKATGNKAAIVLMSDHGSRFIGRKKMESAYNTLHTVYLPGRNYDRWYDGVTNVNTFPLLFQTLYGLDIPLQKDTIIPAVLP